jgi:Zn-dependent protease
MNLETAPVLLPGLIVGLTAHEFAHAWTASLLGDDFARRQGRVSLNPFRHLTPLGTLAILFLPFGWGRPVPVNLYNFARPRRDYLLVSLAGPLMNLVIAGICAGLMYVVLHPFQYDGWRQTAMIDAHRLLMFAVLINVLLAVLNLLPIPPLDGSKIWPCLLPHGKAGGRPRMNGLFMIVLVVLLCSKALSPIFSGVALKVIHWLPVSDAATLDACRECGELAMEEKCWAEAEIHFTRALRINPRDDDLLAGRAEARAAMKNWPAALDDVQKAIALCPLPRRLDLQAEILRRGGKAK